MEGVGFWDGQHAGFLVFGVSSSIAGAAKLYGFFFNILWGPVVPHQIFSCSRTSLPLCGGGGWASQDFGCF